MLSKWSRRVDAFAVSVGCEVRFSGKGTLELLEKCTLKVNFFIILALVLQPLNCLVKLHVENKSIEEISSTYDERLFFRNYMSIRFTAKSMLLIHCDQPFNSSRIRNIGL